MSDEIEEESPYCAECGACGIDGCCPPHRCKYLDQYQGDYAEMAEDVNAMYDMLLQLAKIPAAEEWMRSRLAKAEELLKESTAPAVESTARLITGALEDRRGHKPSW
mgnify:CR=1 FL=1